ncbi:MAG: pilus assembly PilX N-terminal domain-containing protein [Phycisphaerales bacterium JB059]
MPAASTDQANRPYAARRGIAIAVLVIIFALLSFVVIAAVGGSAGDAQIAAIRVETVRASYAAESGAVIIFRSLLDGEDLPPSGSEISLGAESILFVETPPDGVGTVIVEGRCGLASRRFSLEIE